MPNGRTLICCSLLFIRSLRASPDAINTEIIHHSSFPFDQPFSAQFRPRETKGALSIDTLPTWPVLTGE